ncbi:BadF/BadG/BcrA/BcrD ATPase family protein [Burkholderia sp. BCCIQ04A]|uniref:BadF/BadG/BcrA/BcrD ATPase family protein n=1 Tax=Burkholderia anthinoferrum TaxID=3090833 RepID=A0ABU5WUQ2_9BURK|nr:MULTISPECIES: BadF/BadG/BcrA/BcrD ATPase family protein [Burkholderia]MEB2502943.1 BadF/BadG/BcrA/BcrD ATPase family protein [Burkholderia anthinoferrum]MEB2532130.1 BadF/BadG/BcrA/BcrD ATPase family protein [Burkholderia anthinoferrum]MEB2560603.1 BadF/BadG/BcrA/BcrD ATPase family protein [Burkholderia anthinoferrum]MEB2582644.1 BadF/BadG/BcrA/BcrD ATPase family protein [Burkholderia anthinoferrum]KVH06398.1 ATPase [Burkholderia anthina]
MAALLFAIGIDGGGTGTRAVLADRAGRELAQGRGGPSGLGLGIERAWASIGAACADAFTQAGLAFDWSQCALGCGLAGVNNAAWLAAFRAQAPLGALAIESDAYTTVVGAHGGAPGLIVALGTGSIAAALDAAGACRIAGGFGFPSGDEASGAWLGVRALAYAQQALDGRVPRDAFATALLAETGTQDRDALVQWSCDANQTIYARLAPVVFAHRTHPVARALIAQAGDEIGKMIDALDPQQALPVALCGGLADALAPAVPARHAARLRAPLDDSAHGALRLALQALRAAEGG